MSCYKDTTGQWRFRKTIRLADGRSERISGTPNQNSRPAAEKAEREAIDRLENPSAYPESLAKKTTDSFATFAAEWLKTYPPATNKASTVDHRELHIRLHLLPYWQDTPLSKITAQLVMQFVTHMKEKPSQRNTTGPRKRLSTEPQKKLSAQTVKNVLSTLHKILTTAVAWGKLEKLTVFPRIKVPEAEWDWLNKTESALLVAAARDDEERALLLFALKTGARKGEQLTVQWGDIDFVSNTISLKRSIYKRVVGGTKNGKGRTLPLGPVLAEALKRIRHLKGPLVFCDADGKHLDGGQLDTVLLRALRKAGLRKICWHDLRHSFASQLVQAGVNLRQVQTWLDHASIVTTARYAHLAPSEGDKLIAKLDEVEA